MEDAVSVGERGSATALGVAVAGVIVVLALAIATLSASVLSAVKAQSAADFGALAGAHVLWLRGSAAACDAVQSTVEKNHAVLSTCTVTGSHVRVKAIVNGITREAVAGPVDDPP